jgi:secondary thiamine-phosphate synthase enzyme
MQTSLNVVANGRSILDITAKLQEAVGSSGIINGLCHCFVLHTSASLLITENSDPAVLCDLENFMQRLVTDGADYFTHTLEGPDDMSAHIRSVLTQTHITLPICNSALLLGTWQGVFLWEHRYGAHERQIYLTLMAD